MNGAKINNETVGILSFFSDKKEIKEDTNIRI